MFAAKSLNSSSIPVRAEPKPIKNLGIHSFHAWRSASKVTVEVSTACGGQAVVGGSLTREQQC